MILFEKKKVEILIVHVIHAQNKVFGFSFEIWIDGSYLTEKPEPDDIDILIIVLRRVINKLSLDRQYELYNKYFSIEGKSNIKQLYKCDPKDFSLKLTVATFETQVKELENQYVAYQAFEK